MGKAQLDVVNSLMESLSFLAALYVAILTSMITTLLVTREENARILFGWVGGEVQALQAEIIAGSSRDNFSI